MTNSTPTYRIGFTSICGKVAAVIFFIVATCLFLACAHDDSDSKGNTPDANLAKSRTVMVYMIAENSLGYSSLMSDIREIVNGWNNLKPYAGDHLVLYVDDNALPRIYEISKKASATQLTDFSPVYTYPGEANSSSAEQLQSFIQYVKQHYAAESYGLVMWSHASGWLPSTYEKDKTDGSLAKRRAFGLDNQRNVYSDNFNGHQMEIKDMAAALEAEGGVDFIFFDACFMQCIEVAYALRKAADCLIASPAEIPGPGADYTTMVPAMFRKDDYVQQMLSAYYAAYVGRSDYGIVLSAVETERLDAFATEMRDIVQQYKSQLLSLDKQALLNYYVYGVWGTDFHDFLDMQGVMKAVLPTTEYEQWKTKLDAFVSCQATSQWYSVAVPSDSWSRQGGMVDVIPSQCSGVSMTIPFAAYASGTSRFDVLFQTTEWAQTVWNASSDEGGE